MIKKWPITNLRFKRISVVTTSTPFVMIGGLVLKPVELFQIVDGGRILEVFQTGKL